MARPLAILVLSDLWPPHAIGGYELGAADLSERLAARGHRVTVLTSTHGVARHVSEGHVHRLLCEEAYPRTLRQRDLLRETARSLAALARARRFLRRATFDVVHLFNPLGLSAAFIEDACGAGRPAVAYVSDDWVVRWPGTDPLLARWLESDQGFSPVLRALRRRARRLLALARALPRDPARPPVTHAQFVSRYIRDLCAPRLALASEEVIPWGVALERFPFRERRPEELARWVYVGQIEEHKGAHVVVDAVERLRRRGRDVRLTLYGRDTTAYAARLKARVAEAGLGDRVRFAGPRPRAALPVEAYDPGGLLVFATVWPEPFSLTLLEAFAAGLPVLTTVTGGTGELVSDGDNAIAYAAGDAEDLAARWEALARAPEHALAMARRARAAVESRHTLELMAERVEAHLGRVCGG